MINSTTLLQVIRQISFEAGDNIPIDIAGLATQLGITVPKLVSVLTELEHRDLVMLNIKTDTDASTSEPRYEGTIRMMEIPPDEKDDGPELPS